LNTIAKSKAKFVPGCFLYKSSTNKRVYLDASTWELREKAIHVVLYWENKEEHFGSPEYAGPEKLDFTRNDIPSAPKSIQAEMRRQLIIFDEEKKEFDKQKKIYDLVRAILNHDPSMSNVPIYDLIDEMKLLDIQILEFLEFTVDW